MSEPETIYGLLAEFGSCEALVAAVRRVRAEGYRDVQAYTPYPVEGLDEELGLRPTRLPWIVFAAGCLGAAGGFLMQWFAYVVHWPIDVGGRPHNSWPAFIPITFELTILTAAIVGFVAMLAANGLPRLHHPLFGAGAFARASRDGFLLCIRSDDPKFDRQATRQFLVGLAANEVTEVSQ
jgi:hypothetical protein